MGPNKPPLHVHVLFVFPQEEHTTWYLAAWDQSSAGPSGSFSPSPMRWLWPCTWWGSPRPWSICWRCVTPGPRSVHCNTGVLLILAFVLVPGAFCYDGGSIKRHQDRWVHNCVVAVGHLSGRNGMGSQSEDHTVHSVLLNPSKGLNAIKCTVLPSTGPARSAGYLAGSHSERVCRNIHSFHRGEEIQRDLQLQW